MATSIVSSDKTSDHGKDENAIVQTLLEKLWLALSLKNELKTDSERKQYKGLLLIFSLS